MSRVIIFSRFFPAYHPRKEEETFFVSKIWKSIGYYDHYFALPILKNAKPKHHTIRAGNRWKVGDKFSPRIWSGKPYRSKQIVIAPDIEIKKVFKIELEEIIEQENGTGITCTIDGKLQNIPTDLPKNDGLQIVDFVDWFNLKTSKPFEGQIICWNETVKY